MRVTVDARGLSCPEPVIRLKRVISGYDEIELKADSAVCVENCARFAESRGFRVTVEGGRGDYTLIITKAEG